LTREEVKQKLSEYLDAVDSLNTARQNLEALENQLTGISIDYSNERVTSSQISFDRIGDQVDQLAALRQAFEERKQCALRLMQGAVRLVNLCQTAQRYNVLCRRYIRGESWDDIVTQLHYSYSHVLRLHAEGIDEIADRTENMIVNESK